jgi:rod shape-determining protein MreC
MTRQAPGLPASARDRNQRKRWIVLVLALASLLAITIFSRESSSGPLHRVQGEGSRIFEPFQIAADRIARPFADAYGWARSLIDAKSENGRLKSELRTLRANQIAQVNAQAELKRLQALLQYEHAPTFPGDFSMVNAQVISGPAGPFQQTALIAAGSNQGIRINDPVVNADGLVGTINEVGPTSAQVKLVTDPSFAASAVDLATGAKGLVHQASGSIGTLLLDDVTKDRVVRTGDSIVTSGWQRGSLSSIFPPGISLGVVTSQSQTDIDIYKQIEVAPSVDVNGLDAVAVLIPKSRRA